MLLSQARTLMKFVKSNSKRFFIWTTALAAALRLGAGHCSAQVAVTVTPSTTSNTYSGAITLNITGLTNGESVRVQTYLDLNSNGVIDANDPLVDVFDITDGGAEVIGGITNVSVPYDSNTATGSITTALSFAPSLESVVGQKIYRVISNPSGAFTPVTAVLDITNATTGQYASGVVYSNDGVTPLPDAVVVALTAVDQKYASATIADGSGHYLLALNPGSYVLLPGLPGYYTDQNLLPEVTLTNGMSATNNLSLTNGTVSVSGSLFDAGNSNALSGEFLQAQSGSLFEVVFTDTNGNYTFYGTSNNWKIKISDERLARRGYLTPQGNALTVDASFGPVANANIGLYKGNALFYGQVTISNVPVPNAAIAANDDQQLLSSKGFTDLNGNYGVAVLVNTNVLGTNATWNCSPNTADSTGTAIFALANYIFSQVSEVGFTNNQSVLQNFIGLPVTATISGRLVNNQGTPLASIGIGANATISSNQFTTAYIDTDTNGDYSFGAASGQWYVNANCCGNDGLDNFGYYDPANEHVVNIPPTNAVVNIVVYPANLPLLGQPGKIPPQQFNFNLYGASGFNYTVQASTNLATTNWSTLTIVSNFPGSPYLIQDTHATNTARFYRAFKGP
jgi:hypothetical protein